MPGRGQGTGRGHTTSKRGRRVATSSPGVDGRTSAAEAYNDMLEQEAATAHPEPDKRPLKRRKVQHATDEAPSSLKRDERQSPSPARSSPPPEDRLQQVVFDDTASASDDSDVEFEDVELEANDALIAPTDDHEAEQKDLSLSLEPKTDTQSRTRTQKRLPSSRTEKQKRVNVHKVHLQCLLSHVYIRSVWCNDSAVQKALRPLMTKKILALLNKPASRSQFERSDAFKEGLKEASEIFRGVFRLSRRGMSRPEWIVMSKGSEKKRRLDDLEQAITKGDFIHAATSWEGSRDTGAQLFCALLRSVGIDTRLVCSLQPLSFAAAAPAAHPPPDTKQSMTEAEYLAPRQREATPPPQPPESTQDDTTSPQAPTRIKRFGGPKSTTNAPTTTTKPAKRDLGTAPPSSTPYSPYPKNPLLESSSPVFWVEAFSPAYQSWVPCDPLVTRSVGKSRTLEPALHDSLNLLSYVVAFEDDGTAKDVTRRYAKAYNAKTRRHRIESTPGGERYWKRVLKYFHGNLASDRDQVEDAELANLEAREPMPRNVVDFKDHPVFALERHLRRNEVIWPRKQVGKVGTGRGGSVVEAVYRRGDVKVIKAAQKWYREGREVRTGEQPLKYAVLTQRQRRQMRKKDREEGEDEETGAGLYAVYQTELYVPPPVVGGKIPKNAFGNLDVYVPNMIPPGAAHIRALQAKQAAKVLRVDFADAVTGFSFQGRRGTAVTQGVIVARVYAEAVAETVRSLRYECELEAQEKQTERILGLWRRFMVGLRVLQRVSRHFEDHGSEKDNKSEEVRDKIIEAEEQEKQAQEEGGFMLEQDSDIIAGHGNQEDQAGHDFAAAELDAHPSQVQRQSGSTTDCGSEVIIIYSPWDRQSIGTPPQEDAVPSDRQDGGRDGKSEELFGEEPYSGDDFMQGDSGGGFLPDKEEEGGGGFLPDADEVGGGFIAEAEEAPCSPMRNGEIIHAQEVSRPSTDSPVETAERAMLNLIDHGDEADASNESDDVKMSGAPESSDEKITTAKQDQHHEDPRASPDEETHDMPSVQPDYEVGDGADGGGAEQDDQSSQGSLLSHDPDDEEAEPDWL